MCRSAARRECSAAGRGCVHTHTHICTQVTNMGLGICVCTRLTFDAVMMAALSKNKIDSNAAHGTRLRAHMASIADTCLKSI